MLVAHPPMGQEGARICCRIKLKAYTCQCSRVFRACLVACCAIGCSSPNRVLPSIGRNNGTLPEVRDLKIGKSKLHLVKLLRRVPSLGPKAYKHVCSFSFLPLDFVRLADLVSHAIPKFLESSSGG
jgi:hypothetical protein